MKSLEEWKPNFFQEEKKIIHIFVTLSDKMYISHWSFTLKLLWVTKTISPYNINQTRDMNKVKYKFGDNYRNFRPITRAADYPHWSIFVETRKKISTDYLHWQITRTQKKENRWLTQSSFIVLVDMLSFSVQLINFHTFCLRCFIENDTNCKNLF